MWKSFFDDVVSFNRIEFKNGYECFVFCTVQKEARDVAVISSDGEANYYPLSTAWKVSWIKRSFFKLKVLMMDELYDINSHLEDLLLAIDKNRIIQLK